MEVLKTEQPIKTKKKDTLADVLFHSDLKPSIFPKSFFEADHFALDAL